MVNSFECFVTSPLWELYSWICLICTADGHLLKIKWSSARNQNIMVGMAPFYGKKWPNNFWYDKVMILFHREILFTIFTNHVHQGIRGSQMSGFFLVVDAPYVVDKIKNEIDHHLLAVYPKDMRQSDIKVIKLSQVRKKLIVLG